MEASRNAPEPSTDDLNERFAARLNADTRPNAGALNTTALPNPWAPPPRPQTNAAARKLAPVLFCTAKDIINIARIIHIVNLHTTDSRVNVSRNAWRHGRV